MFVHIGNDIFGFLQNRTGIKKRHFNVLRGAVFEGIEVAPDNFFNLPIHKLARFKTNNSSTWGDFEHRFMIHEDMQVDKKIDDSNLLKTDSFFGKSLDKTLEETDLEKYNLDQYKIKGNYFTNINKTIKASEHTFFLYDNQNIINETFVSEVGKKISLIGVWYFVKPGSSGKIELVTSKNKLKFNIKENQILPVFSIGIAPVTASKKIRFKQEKIKNILIISAPAKTRKRKMTEVVETLLIKVLQNFDNYTVLNPVDVDIRSNYMTEKINSYKGHVYQVLIRNLLFIVCYNLDSAKKALINGKLYSILGIVNLSEINNWDVVKGKSVYVSVKFDDINSTIESAIHFAFKFKTAFPTEIFEFKIELLDDQAKQIKFGNGEIKVPALDIQIDVLK